MKSPGVWIATATILVVGILLLLSMNRADRGRLDAMGDVEVGQPAAGLDALLGIAHTACPVGELGHLRESFPQGWSPAAIDVALEQLHSQTLERWVYPVGDAQPSCDGRSEQTEVGVGRDGSIVWSLPILGNSVLELPPTVTPAGVDSLVSGQRSI